MNLYLRLLIVWLKSKFRPPIGILDECVSDFRVWLTDLDMLMHMTNSRYLAIADVCVIDYMMRCQAWPKFMARRWMPIVLFEDMVFIRQLKFPQRFTVRSKLLGWSDRHALIRHIFERADGKVAAEGFTVARFICVTDGARVAPQDVLKVMGLETPSPPLSPLAQDALRRAAEGYDLKGTGN